MTVYYLPFNYKKVLLEAIQDKNKQIQNNKISKDASNSNNTTFDQKKKQEKRAHYFGLYTTKVLFKDDVTAI